MPRAEVGTAKHLANKMKAKGLQRLRWYCQVCERQMRDENGFKCHTSSESHVRQMLLVGEDPKKHIENYSRQFKHDFLLLLRTSHGEKKIDANRFYQEYIANKEHIHMTSTKWVTLSEFVKHLGREAICRVEDGERGLMVAWIDNSPEALKRQEIVRRKERMERGDEVREQRAIKEMVQRAQAQATQAADDGPTELVREEGEKVRLAFGKKMPDDEQTSKSAAATATPTNTTNTTTTTASSSTTATAAAPEEGREEQGGKGERGGKEDTAEPAKKLSMKMEAKPKKNVFAAMGKKDKKDKSKDREAKKGADERKRPISEAERIMKEEMGRNRLRYPGPAASGVFKRQRTS